MLTNEINMYRDRLVTAEQVYRPAVLKDAPVVHYNVSGVLREVLWVAEELSVVLKKVLIVLKTRDLVQIIAVIENVVRVLKEVLVVIQEVLKILNDHHKLRVFEEVTEEVIML